MLAQWLRPKLLASGLIHRHFVVFLGPDPKVRMLCWHSGYGRNSCSSGFWADTPAFRGFPRPLKAKSGIGNSGFLANHFQFINNATVRRYLVRAVSAPRIDTRPTARALASLQAFNRQRHKWQALLK
jgi:hypothetical protein